MSELQESDAAGADLQPRSPVGRMTSKQAFAQATTRMTAKEAAALSLQRMTPREAGQRAAGAGVSGDADKARRPNRTGLPEELKTGIEILSGVLMDDVKVQYNSVAPAQLQALAYTRGSEIHIAPGQERHLPHEAWHVVQQRQGRVPATGQLNGMGLNDDPALEAEADIMGARAARSGGGGGPVSLARAQSAAAVGGSHPPIQRARLNVRPADGIITGVSEWINRPPSNLQGTQGQHLTAYVVFRDMITSHVRGRTVAQAAQGLIDVLESIRRLPGMRSDRYLGAYISQSIGALQRNPADTRVVGAQIDQILRIRNQVPGTAQRGTGGGSGESETSGILSRVETALRNNDWPGQWREDTVAEQCQESMWRLLDYDPSPPTNEEQRGKIVRAVLTHFMSLQVAYPEVFEWLTQRGAYLFDYLEGHRNDSNMPLSRLAPETLEEIRDEVEDSIA
ncbi:eCIS core domain-containing protein [Sorangium sp. So ce1024]|uniref:eCIS core domain-containing protein n=1 Tax=Sorangium sp. So ce1024 TaxID=3133327 RepID=UPI003F0A54F1